MDEQHDFDEGQLVGKINNNMTVSWLDGRL